MTLPRMIFVLVLALAVMLTVIILRAETTRLHEEIAARDERTEVLARQLRKDELHLQRLRNPALLRERARELRPAAPAPAPAPVAPEPPVRLPRMRRPG